MKTKKLIFAALFAALTCVATMIIKVPTPTMGYIHGRCRYLDDHGTDTYHGLYPSR